MSEALKLILMLIVTLLVHGNVYDAFSTLEKNQKRTCF